MVSKNKRKEILEVFIFKVLNDGFDYTFDNYSTSICKLDDELSALYEECAQAKRKFLDRASQLMDEGVKDGLLDEGEVEEFKDVIHI